MRNQREIARRGRDAAGGAGRKRANARAAQKAPLTEQQIIDCTLRLIRADGLESLSMRKLAHELGVAPMSLYHHVRNKDELLARVVEALLARIPTPPARRKGWRDQLRSYAVAVIVQLTMHPGIARIVVERPPSSESQRHLRYTGAVLMAAGFDARTTAQCLATFHTFIYGVLAARAQLPALMATIAKKYDAPIDSAQNASPGSQGSAISVNEHLRNLGLHGWYETAIDSILSALALQLRASRTRTGRNEVSGLGSNHPRGEA